MSAEEQATNETGNVRNPHSGLFSITTASLFAIGRLQNFRVAALHASTEALASMLRTALDRAKEAAAEGAPKKVDVSDVEAGFSDNRDFVYVSDVSHLVYATAIFDTFLSDVSLFLHLLNPSSIGEDKAISLSLLLGSRSREEAITTLARKVVRELGYQSFLVRIDALRRRFGLSVDLPEEVEKHLDHYSGVRNTLAHDHGFLEVALASDGLVVVQQKRDPYHPTPITSDDVVLSTDVYMLVMLSIYRAICRRVLKVEPDGRLEKTGEGLEGKIAEKARKVEQAKILKSARDE